MSNITKELESSKVKQAQSLENNDVLNEVKLLMNSDSQEDLRIFRGLGNNHSIAHSETELGKKLELEQLDGKYSGNVFTSDQIKQLCVKYNLRFLHSKSYRGKMDVQVAAKLKEFSKLTGTEISEGNLNYNFFILAPENAFKLKTEKRLNMWDDKDPAIFYKIDENHYRLIHKWGSDFTIWNRVKGIRNASASSSILLKAVVLMTLLTPILLYILDKFHGSYWFTLLLIPFVFLVSYLDETVKFRDAVTPDKDHYSPEKWNSPNKLV